MGQRFLTSFKVTSSPPLVLLQSSLHAPETPIQICVDSSYPDTTWVLLLWALWFFQNQTVTEKGQRDIILPYQPLLPPGAQVGKMPSYSQLVPFSSNGCEKQPTQFPHIPKPVMLEIRSIFKTQTDFFGFLVTPRITSRMFLSADSSVRGAK